MEIAHPYLLFLADVQDQLAAKTAQGIVDWRSEWVAGQLRLENCKADVGVPDMSIEEAAAEGVKTLVIGAVNAGGVLPDHWIDSIVTALHAGMDVASGLHSPLRANMAIAAAAESSGQTLFDVRLPSEKLVTGKGIKRSGLRLLTVGTDCSVGKKYTSLAIEKEMRERGFDADFRATGQTGIFISGRGMSIDAVPADFISGTVEWIAPENEPTHWDIIEGQGSLYHPSFAGVSLGLIHGAQADAFVVCHEPTRTNMRGVSHPIPTIDEVIDLTIRTGKLTNPAIRPVGIAVNTYALDDDSAGDCLRTMETQYGIPACDPIRGGVGDIIDNLEKHFSKS